MKWCLYSTGTIFDDAVQTGGIKRFVEIVGYVGKNCTDYVLYSRDEVEVVKSRGIRNVVKIENAKKKYALLPPEFSLWLSNIKNIRDIKKEGYDSVISVC